MSNYTSALLESKEMWYKIIHSIANLTCETIFARNPENLCPDLHTVPQSSSGTSRNLLLTGKQNKEISRASFGHTQQLRNLPLYWEGQFEIWPLSTKVKGALSSVRPLWGKAEQDRIRERGRKHCRASKGLLSPQNAPEKSDEDEI